jgi:hypothetical protein
LQWRESGADCAIGAGEAPTADDTAVAGERVEDMESAALAAVIDDEEREI